MKQLPLPVQLRASSVFASFYPGSNAPVVEQLRAVRNAERPVSIWLYGPSAVGKTHLLQALCAQAGAEGLAAAYLPLRDAAMQSAMLSGCEALRLVALDDFEVHAGDLAWERAVFRLYTELEDSGGRLVIAATAPPTALPLQLKDLTSRLAVSVLLRLVPLNDEEQIAALQLRAARLGLELPLEVATFMIRRLPRDMTTLCNALDTFDRASLADQRRLTLPFVRTVLEGYTLS